MRKYLFVMALILCLAGTAQAAETWLSGQSHFYSRRGLTGGGTALDALSGLSMCPNDYAITLDISGNSIYVHQVSATGNASGTTTESSPDWIMPNSAESGGTLAGVSMWKLTGLTGVTGVFRTLVIDNRTIVGTTVDAWNAIQSQVSAFVTTQLAAYLASSAFSGATDFALDSAVTDFVRGLFASYLASSAFTGATDFALDSAVSNFVHGLLASYLGTGDVAGVSLAQVYALQAMVTDALTQAAIKATGFATNAELTAETATAAIKASGFATNAELTAHTGASPWTTIAVFSAAGAPETTSGVSFFSGMTQYILNAAQTGVTGQAGVSRQIEWTIVNPTDVVVPGSGATPVKLFTIVPNQYKNGVVLVEMMLENLAGNTTYQATYTYWPKRDAASGVSIGTLTATSGVSDVRTGATIIPPGSKVFIHLPQTQSYEVGGYFIFYPR